MPESQELSGRGFIRFLRRACRPRSLADAAIMCAAPLVTLFLVRPRMIYLDEKDLFNGPGPLTNTNVAIRCVSFVFFWMFLPLVIFKASRPLAVLFNYERFYEDSIKKPFAATATFAFALFVYLRLDPFTYRVLGDSRVAMDEVPVLLCIVFAVILAVVFVVIGFAVQLVVFNVGRWLMPHLIRFRKSPNHGVPK